MLFIASIININNYAAKLSANKYISNKYGDKGTYDAFILLINKASVIDKFYDMLLHSPQSYYFIGHT